MYTVFCFINTCMDVRFAFYSNCCCCDSTLCLHIRGTHTKRSSTVFSLQMADSSYPLAMPNRPSDRHRIKGNTSTSPVEGHGIKPRERLKVSAVLLQFFRVLTGANMYRYFSLTVLALIWLYSIVTVPLPPNFCGFIVVLQ